MTDNTIEWLRVIHKDLDDLRAEVDHLRSCLRDAQGVIEKKDSYIREQAEECSRLREEIRCYGEHMERKVARLRDALQDIATGHHDPMPTRLLFKNSDAAMCDEWWQAYYTSNDQRNKEIAREALKG